MAPASRLVVSESAASPLLLMTGLGAGDEGEEPEAEGDELSEMAGSDTSRWRVVRRAEVEAAAAPEVGAVTGDGGGGGAEVGGETKEGEDEGEGEDEDEGEVGGSDLLERSKRKPEREPAGPCGRMGATEGELLTLALVRAGGRAGRLAGAGENDDDKEEEDSTKRMSGEPGALVVGGGGAALRGGTASVDLLREEPVVLALWSRRRLLELLRNSCVGRGRLPVLADGCGRGRRPGAGLEGGGGGGASGGAGCSSRMASFEVGGDADGSGGALLPPGEEGGGRFGGPPPPPRPRAAPRPRPRGAAGGGSIVHTRETTERDERDEIYDADQVYDADEVRR